MIIELKDTSFDVADHDLIILRDRYHSIDNLYREFGPNKPITIPITNDEWISIQNFNNTLELPTSDQGWINLLIAAKHLSPTIYYNRIIREEGEKYVTEIKKARIVVKDLSFFCLVEKIRYPGFISVYELEEIDRLERCDYCVMKGKRLIRCKNKKEEGDQLCGSCKAKRSLFN